MAENGRIHLNRASYTNVGSIALFDATLSMRAKGLYATMTAYACIPNFKLYKKHLVNQFPEGSTAFNSAWNELINKGYLVMTKTQDEGGKYTYDYSVQDTPVEVPEENQRKTKRVRTKKKPEVEKPHMEKPHMDEPHLEKPHLKVNTENNNILERKAEPPKPVKKELSDDAQIVNTMVPSLVHDHEKFDPEKLVKVAKSKDGKQYTGYELAEVLSESYKRYMKVFGRGDIGDDWSYFFKIVKSVSGQWETIKSKKSRKAKKPVQKAPNSFHNFHQREDYDYDRLEIDLLNAQW